MKFAKLQTIAREMEPDQVVATLKQLCNDPRFAAVLRVITDQKESASDISCQIRFSEAHGALAHAAGSRHALITLEGTLRQACDVPKKSGPEEGRGERGEV